MKITDKLMLGLLILTPGLYASEYTEEDAKRDSAQINTDLGLLERDCARIAQLTDELTREEDLERIIETSKTIERERASVVLPPQTDEQTKKLDELYEVILCHRDDAQTRMLLSSGTDVISSGTDVNGRIPRTNSSLLHNVHDKPTAVGLLLNAKADVNSITTEKDTPLHRQCQVADMRLFKISDVIECIKLILAHPKIIVNAQNIYLRTPLHELLSPYHDYSRAAPIVQLLLEHGANSNMVDARRKTVFDCAMEKYDIDKDKRSDIRNVLLLFDAHREKIDATATVLRSCPGFPDCGKHTTDRIVAEYYCGIRPNDRLLNTALIKVASVDPELQKKS